MLVAAAVRAAQIQACEAAAVSAGIAKSSDPRRSRWSIGSSSFCLGQRFDHVEDTTSKGLTNCSVFEETLHTCRLAYTVSTMYC